MAEATVGLWPTVAPAYSQYSRRRERPNHTRSPTPSPQVLSRCRGLVGKFTSNLFRAVVEMAAAQTGCVPPFASIDASWCGDAGAPSGHVEVGPMAGRRFNC